MSSEQKSEPSIELLGQKFTYPSTWQGVLSVLFICSTISFIAWTLEPEQIQSYRGVLGLESNKQVEESLVDLNEKLNTQVGVLKKEVFSLTKKAKLEEPEKKKIISKVNVTDKEISKAYSDLVSKQIERKNLLNRELQYSNKKKTPLLDLEQSRLTQQLQQFQQQQQQQQQQQWK